MKKNILSVLKVTLFLALGILLIWLAVKDLTSQDKTQIIHSLSEANYTWVIASMLCGLLAHVSRAVRWKMLLKTLQYNPSLANTFYAVMIGYLGNLALPRLGEVLRCSMLKRYNHIPITSSLGTVIAERIIDLFTLLFLFILSIFIEYTRMKEYIQTNIFLPLKDKLIHLATSNLPLLAIGIAILAVLLFLLRKKITNNPLTSKLQSFINSFLEGMKTVVKVEKPLLFIFHSCFIWLMYLLSVFVCVFSFKETQTMTLTDCLAIMCFGSLGVIATPGGIGAYQWIVLQLMILWGYSTSIGVAFGWIAWLSQTTIVLVIGLSSFALIAINKRANINPSH